MPLRNKLGLGVVSEYIWLGEFIMCNGSSYYFNKAKFLTLLFFSMAFTAFIYKKSLLYTFSYSILLISMTMITSFTIMIMIKSVIPPLITILLISPLSSERTFLAFLTG